MQEDVVQRLLMLRFPGLLQHHSDEQDLENLFVRTIKLYQTPFSRPPNLCPIALPWLLDKLQPKIPADGRSALPLSSPLFGKVVDRHGPQPYPLYHGGLVAWQPGRGEIVLDNLHLGQRTRFTTTADPRIRTGNEKLMTMSDKLIVLAVSSTATDSRNIFRFL